MRERVLRRYDLTAAVVRVATGRRLAGDWRGACAAARIAVDPQVVARAGAVPELADDLRHLAPELVRWHLLGADLRATHWWVAELARYRDEFALFASVDQRAGGPTRLGLAIGTQLDLTLRPFPRCRWDARRVGELPAHLAGGARTWYLDPLAAGHLAPAALPPLVRTALFPDRADEPYAPMPGVRVPDRFHVQCRGRHYVGWRDGTLRLLSHDPEDERRERVLHALGGPVVGCFRVQRAWERRTGRLPDRMRAVARHMFLAAAHGDLAELTRLLDEGVDPRGVRGPEGQSLLHLADQIADAGAIRRLMRAGLDPGRADDHGRRARDTDWLSGRR